MKVAIILLVASLILGLVQFHGVADDYQYQIAFQGEHATGKYAIYLANTSDLSQQQLTDDGDSWYPQWSPTDPNLLVFKNGTEQIVILDVATREETVLSADVSYATQPAWSPDGEKIVFSGTQQLIDGYDLFQVNKDGSNLQQIAHGHGNITYSAWSPDNTLIAFISHSGESQHFMNFLDVDKRIVFDIPIGYPKDYLAWSPDSDEIAFVTSRGELKIISIRDMSINEINLQGSVNNPSWSPDGTQIAFVSDNNIFVMDRDGTNIQQITNQAIQIYAISWRSIP